MMLMTAADTQDPLMMLSWNVDLNRLRTHANSEKQKLMYLSANRLEIYLDCHIVSGEGIRV
jgi:hypothetical protein